MSIGDEYSLLPCCGLVKNDDGTKDLHNNRTETLESGNKCLRCEKLRV